jgi:hypothetical protein|tara:strand:+ start:90 stop:311 length:222 start_codon:yes stop_codon:yes gene_type:complete
MWSFLFPYAKQVILKHVGTPSYRKVVIEFLEVLVRSTETDLDDMMLKRLKKAILAPTGKPLSKQLLKEQKNIL